MIVIYRLNTHNYEKMKMGAVVIGKDEGDDKVVKLSDGSILKWFKKPSTWFSFAHIFPYALRFLSHVRKLESLGITTVKPITIFRLEKSERLSVQYHPIEGETVRSAFYNGSIADQLVLAGNFGAFVARLHHLGIYFRSLHFGNVIVLKNGSFGLIDVSDMKFRQGTLINWHRLRNFKHIARCNGDLKMLEPFREVFLTHYLADCNKNISSSKIEVILMPKL